jgi:hypothetical protein
LGNKLARCATLIDVRYCSVVGGQRCLTSGRRGESRNRSRALGGYFSPKDRGVRHHANGAA